MIRYLKSSTLATSLTSLLRLASCREEDQDTVNPPGAKLQAVRFGIILN